MRLAIGPIGFEYGGGTCAAKPSSQFQTETPPLSWWKHGDRTMMAGCTFQITGRKGVWRACGAPAELDQQFCAGHHTLCQQALGLVEETIASHAVSMYYIGLTHWGHQRFYGTMYRPVWVAGALGPAKEALGPAEAASLEKFLQDKCKLSNKQGIAYRKYDPAKRDLPYRASLGASPALFPIYSVYVACAEDGDRVIQVNGYPIPISPTGHSSGSLATMADFLVQFRIGLQLHVDGPEYVPYNAGSKAHNKYFQFKSYREANKWLIDRLIHDPKLGHKLAPETVKGRPELLNRVGIVHSKLPRLTKPYPGLFDFSVRPLE
jgi:hypothetical protein